MKFNEIIESNIPLDRYIESERKTLRELLKQVIRNAEKAAFNAAKQTNYRGEESYLEFCEYLFELERR